MKLGARLGRAFDRTLDVMAWIGCALIVFQMVSVSAEVVSRYFFGISFGWVTSLNEWSLVLITFLGVAWLHREGGHTSDDSIVDLLPGWARTGSAYLGFLLALVTCGMLTWYGAKVTWANYVSNAYDFFKLRGVPVFYIYMVIPIGSLLWLIQVIRSARKDGIRKIEQPQSGPEI